MKNPDTEAFIGHIVMAMDAMLEYVAGMTLEGFLDDRKTRDAVIRNLNSTSWTATDNAA